MRNLIWKLRVPLIFIIWAVGFYVLINLPFYQRFPETIFPGIEGPHQASVFPEPILPNWREYEAGEKSRAAILVLNEKHPWWGLSEGLSQIGIPFCMTNDPSKAFEHSLVFICPALNITALSEAQLGQFRAYVEKGGTLIGFNIAPYSQELFGIDKIDSAFYYTFDFNPDLVPPIHTHKSAINASDGNPFPTLSYTTQKGVQAVATNENQAPVITRYRQGKGSAIAFGIDLSAFILRCQNQGQSTTIDNYANSYKPDADIILLYLRELYREVEPNAVTLYTVPHNKKLTVLMTHDIDYEYSVFDSVKYAEFEKRENFPSTYFMQTKYVKDYYDQAFFTPITVPYLIQIRDYGMEIGSHSVAHSAYFAKFPLGTGFEMYPTYKPINIDLTQTINGTVFGELRASKFLLEKLVGVKVRAFRPGFLAEPVPLGGALVGSGYEYSSSITTGQVCTYLPFQQNYQRSVMGRVQIFEFPLTVSDTLATFSGQIDMLARAEEFIQLAKKIGSYGGICAVLLHPTDVGKKFRFVKRFCRALKEIGWFSSLSNFGDWWVARRNLSVDVQGDGQQKVIQMKSQQPLQGITLHIPPHWLPYKIIPEGKEFNLDEQDLVLNVEEEEIVQIYLRKDGSGTIR